MRLGRERSGCTRTVIIGSPSSRPVVGSWRCLGSTRPRCGTGSNVARSTPGVRPGVTSEESVALKSLRREVSELRGPTRSLRPRRLSLRPSSTGQCGDRGFIHGHQGHRAEPGGPAMGCGADLPAEPPPNMSRHAWSGLALRISSRTRSASPATANPTIVETTEACASDIGVVPRNGRARNG